ncbi:MAG: PilZ domain-containing protein [Desulfurivibrionaceae bacterium]|nr:PilZ domain-containing protein [Desulfurivibrionaceae bacterium]
MGFENRESERKDALNLLDFIALDESGAPVDRAMARTLNVSERGILLETHLSLNEGQNLLITIGLGDNLCEIRGRIVRSEKRDENKFHYGVEFLEMSASDAATLAWYLKNFNDNHL